jgi:hypothetical protein
MNDKGSKQTMHELIQALDMLEIKCVSKREPRRLDHSPTDSKFFSDRQINNEDLSD